MKKVIIFLFSTALGLGFTIGDVPNSLAQSSATEEFTLEEITVTAQKREEDQQKVAAAMEVISGTEMSELGKNNIEEILEDIGSAIVNKGPEGMRVSIRGMSQDSGLFGGIQTQTLTVALNTDGVYTNKNTGGQNMFDVERVEVLYGPQSTMYASATPGGIVNIITSNPNTEKYETSGVIEFGNYDLIHTEGVLNVPFGNKVALRAGFTSNKRDGYLSNGSDDEDSVVGRLKMMYKPNDKFSIILTGEKQNSGGQGMAGVAAFIKQDDVDDPWTAASTTSGPPRKRSRSQMYGNIQYDFDFGALTVIPSISRTDQSTSQTSTATVNGVVVNEMSMSWGFTKEKGVEARLASSSDYSIKWIIGLNLYQSLDDRFNYTFQDNELSREQHLWNDQRQKAIFGNITYPVTDQFRATAGARYSWDEVSTFNYENPGPPGKIMPEGLFQEFKNPDYKFGIEYDIAKDSMVYADLSSGYRVTGGTGAKRPAEKLTAYTIGSKNRFFGNKVQINASGFFYDYKDKYAISGVNTIQDLNGNTIRDWDDIDGDGVKDENEPYTENSTMLDENAKQFGDLEVYGVDLQTNTIITSRDKVDFSVSYLKKTWTKLFFDFWDITNNIGIPDLDYSGNEMTFAPHWNISLTYSHNFNLALGTLTARFENKYQSGYKMYFLDKVVSLTRDGSAMTDVWVKDLAYQEGYMLHDVSAVYAHADGKWTLTGYVKNITNYAVKKSINIMGYTGSDLVLGPPRTYGAVLTLKY